MHFLSRILLVTCYDIDQWRTWAFYTFRHGIQFFFAG